MPIIWSAIIIAGIVMLFLPSGIIFGLSLVISLPFAILTFIDGHYTWTIILVIGIIIALIKRD